MDPFLAPQTNTDGLEFLPVDDAGSRSTLWGVAQAQSFFGPDLGERQLGHFRHHLRSILETLSWLCSTGRIENWRRFRN